MKAIILAAGKGSRLGDLTRDKPKCMVEYRGKPIIDYQLEVMRDCGIDDITVVTGYQAEALKRDGVKTVVNAEYEETNMVYSLFCCGPHFDDDLIISYGDIVYSKEVLDKLLNSQAEFAITIDTAWWDLWSRRMDDPLSDAETMKLDAAGNIYELGKPAQRREDIAGLYMGLIMISESLVTDVTTQYHKLLQSGVDVRSMYMTDFLQSLVDSQVAIKAVPIEGGWMEFDLPTDLNVAPLRFDSI